MKRATFNVRLPVAQNESRGRAYESFLIECWWIAEAPIQITLVDDLTQGDGGHWTGRARLENGAEVSLMLYASSFGLSSGTITGNESAMKGQVIKKPEYLAPEPTEAAQGRFERWVSFIKESLLAW